MPSPKKANEHTMNLTVVGADVGIAGYHIGFFVKHVTLKDTASNAIKDKDETKQIEQDLTI